jgi:hypothetical protein
VRREDAALAEQTAATPAATPAPPAPADGVPEPLDAADPTARQPMLAHLAALAAIPAPPKPRSAPGPAWSSPARRLTFGLLALAVGVITCVLAAAAWLMWHDPAGGPAMSPVPASMRAPAAAPGDRRRR